MTGGMKTAAWRVGLFAVVGIAVLALALVMVGGRWFADSERALLRFDNSVFGLQDGALVVFRGVRIGQVVRIQLAPAAAGEVVTVVTAELDRARMAELLGPNASGGAYLPQLIARGLYARLATQSLLTGLLYVDLDLRKNEPASAQATAAQADGLPLIPTEPNTLQTLKAQLEQVDVAQIAEDLAAIAANTRALVGNPELAQTIERASAAALAVQQLAQALQTQVGPLAGATRQTLGSVDQAAARIDAAAAAIQDAAKGTEPLLASLRRSSDALTVTAQTLATAVDADSSLRQNADRALQDVARAARSLRELSDTLERHPDALLRGRQAEPPPAAP